MLNNKWHYKQWSLISLTLLVLSCGQQQAATQSFHTLDSITIGIIPDHNKAQLLEHYSPLFQYISEEMGLEYNLVIPDSYSDLLHLFNRGKVDLAFFEAYTYIQARDFNGATPLAMRDIDLRSSTYLISSQNSELNSLNQLNQKRVMFGSQSSTAEHLMPRLFFMEKGIQPETIFGEIVYAKSNDKFTPLLANNTVDAAFVNSHTYSSLKSERQNFKVIWQSPPYANLVWTIHPNLDPVQTQKLLDTFLNLSLFDPQHRKILNSISAKTFMPARDKLFEPVAKTARMLDKPNLQL